MKKAMCMIFIGVFCMAGVAMGFDASARKASLAAVDAILDYYTAMADIQSENQSLPGDPDFILTLNLLKQEKKQLVQKVLTAQAYRNLGLAYRVVDAYVRKNQSHAYTSEKKGVSAPVYYDIRTGHKYIRLENDTYAELDRKGRFLKNVRADLPLLTKGLHIHPISSENYIQYKKMTEEGKIYISLPALDKHPEGFKAEKLMVSLN